jgi:hypothetical protein
MNNKPVSNTMSKKSYNIAVLLATHKRTDALSRSLFSLIDRAHDLDSIEFRFGIDNDDDIGMTHFTDVIQPELDRRGINYEAIGFDPMGYLGLNRYYNTLAEGADADWLWVWCDDAICETDSWDQRIRECTGEFKLLKVHTHNEHPYSIFPIYPASWHETLGYLSRHQLIDAECSQIAYYLDVMKIIEVNVTHDRADLTGNNADANAQKKKYLEGNPNDPRDLYHESFKYNRLVDTDRLASYMKSQGLDISWWEGIKTGKNNVSEKMKANDPNNQTSEFEVVQDSQGRKHIVHKKSTENKQ